MWRRVLLRSIFTRETPCLRPAVQLLHGGTIKRIQPRRNPPKSKSPAALIYTLPNFVNVDSEDFGVRD